MTESILVLAAHPDDDILGCGGSIARFSKEGKKIIAHEKVHLDQFDRGDLDYDNETVTWKGKTIARSQINEGAQNLPWEKEAYDKTEKS